MAGLSGGVPAAGVGLLAAGRTVADLAQDLGVNEQAIYGWRRQERIDQGVEAGLSTLDRAELAAAKRRIHELEAELAVHRRAAELLMRLAGIQGVAGRPRFRKTSAQVAATDRVGRVFVREQPNQLWVTDITKHPTHEGKVFCAVVLDAFLRRVVGWPIDAAPSAALVTNALGMAIDSPTDSTVIHSDRGTPSALGRSRAAPRSRVCCRRWGPLGPASTMR